MLSILYRNNWNAHPNKGNLKRMVNLRKIVIHHAAGYRDDSSVSGAKRVKEIQELHQNKNGWIDIAYHFLIDSTGCIYQGRDFFNRESDIHNLPEFIHGAHTKNNNSDKIGICLLGCFQPSVGPNCSDVLTAEARDSLVELCVFICNSYKLTRDDILTHQDLRPTDCPGANILRELDNIKVDIDQLILKG